MRRSRDGFTLVEVIVALALFALIGVAGFSMLSGVLQTQEKTDGRLQRLSEIQRAIFVINTDLDQLSSEIDGGADRLVFEKPDLSGRPVVVRYSLEDRRLMRVVSGPAGERSQTLLSGVETLDLTYLRRGGTWLPQTRPVNSENMDAFRPGDIEDRVDVPAVTAVTLNLGLAGVDGRLVSLRRVILVPEVQP